MNILYVTSSSRGAESYSNRVGQNVLDELLARDLAATVTVRDLAREPLPHIGDDFVAARGGIYSGAGNALDFQLPYLKSVLGFIGMTDVEVLEVEGTAYGPDAAEKAVTAATAKLHAQCDQRAAAVAA